MELASPLIFAERRDDLLLSEVYFGKLSSETALHDHSLFQMNECIKSLEEAKVYSTLQTNWGFSQAKVDLLRLQ